MLDEDDPVVDDDADQQQQPDRGRPVEIRPGQVEGPPGSRESEGQGDHQRDGSLHRLEESRHDREDEDEGEDEALGEFPVSLLFLLRVLVKIPAVARGEHDIRELGLDGLMVVLGRLPFLVVGPDPDARQAVFALDPVAPAAPVDIGHGGDGNLPVARGDNRQLLELGEALLLFFIEGHAHFAFSVGSAEPRQVSSPEGQADGFGNRRG